MSLSNPPAYRIDVDPSLKYQKIPPNGHSDLCGKFRQAWNAGAEKTCNFCTGYLYSAVIRKAMCVFTVLDSGPGFSEDILPILNQTDGKTTEGTYWY